MTKIIFLFAVISSLLLLSCNKNNNNPLNENTCTDGIQNQGETAIDRGGPCPLLDAATLTPTAVLWTRAFHVRDGTYSAVAYIENPNPAAGVASVPYDFKLYDADNILVAERTGTTFIMPGGVTPVFEGGIDTGNRLAARAYFEFTAAPQWQQMCNPAAAIAIDGRNTADLATVPRVTAQATNAAVSALLDLSFVAVVFDGAGNAFAASATHMPRLGAGESQPLVFTWPDPFTYAPARVDILPMVAPVSSLPR